jgi:hypothetical protein
MDFFTLTPEQVYQGLDLVYDFDKQQLANKTNDPLLSFAFDTRLQKLAVLWLDSGEDMLMTKLKCDF